MTPLRYGATLLACHTVPARAVFSLRRLGGSGKSCHSVPLNDATSPIRSDGIATSKSGRHTQVPFLASSRSEEWYNKKSEFTLGGVVMMDNLPVVVPSVATTHTTTPSADLPPPVDSNIPAPTAEQAAVSDRVFTEPHPATTLLGVLTSAMLLRDVAVDTFDTSGEEDEEEEKPKEKKNVDPVE
jgi:hypothetical protein